MHRCHLDIKQFSKGIIMGMRVGGGNAAWASQASSVNNWQKSQQGVKDLVSTLNSGDLGAAQQAYAAMSAQKNIPKDSALGKIGQELALGDLAGAQKIAQTMQTNKLASTTATQATVSNKSAPSLLSLLSGQGGSIDMMA
jgi:NADH dehydrogenase/NADH:ubiquinone oxidoreductase subunit G